MPGELIVVRDCGLPGPPIPVTTEGKEPSSVTKQYTEIMVGRPTALEHRHPFNDVRDFTTADSANKGDF
ncbi:MAG: hypothetical protein WBL38_14490 [Desulfomonilia bacterium]|jgi:hypothetical protein